MERAQKSIEVASGIDMCYWSSCCGSKSDSQLEYFGS